MIRLNPTELKAVSDYVYSICAVSLDQSKGYLIEGRLAHIVDELRLPSYGQLIARARTDASGALNRRIIDSITTNETLFFRDTAPFDALRHKVIPDLIDRRTRANSNAPIRIWSAACSTGQEIYTIGIVLKELLGNPVKYNIRLLGTDISDQAVQRASRGVYSSVEMARGMPPNLRDRYFIRRDDNWQIADEIRGLASFRHANLMNDFSALGRFDIVFCRNVAIYFTDQDRANLFRRIERSLERGGYLFIGAMESLSGPDSPFDSERHVRAVIYRPKVRSSP
ncbi:MAG: protein-glutamate O-methyltransferase CheR [Acidobacteria bacterium]|nr:protein-glutamate O-methyltransferase CheR [Acidobacteriota bacterium]